MYSTQTGNRSTKETSASGPESSKAAGSLQEREKLLVCKRMKTISTEDAQSGSTEKAEHIQISGHQGTTLFHL